WPGFRQIDFLTILDEVDAGVLAGLSHIVAYGDRLVERTRAHGKPIVAYDALRRRPPYQGDHGGGPVGCAIFTTSGTTKAPKFVLHDHFSVVSHARAVVRRFGWDAPG